MEKQQLTPTTFWRQEPFGAVLEVFPLSVVITDPNTRILWSNRAFTDMCGYEADEVIGRRPGAFLQGPESDPEIVAEMGRAVRGKKPFEVELVNYRKDGSPYKVAIQMRPLFDEDGKTRYFFAVEREVTREREAEEGRDAYLLTLYDRLSQVLDCPMPDPECLQTTRN